MKGKKMKRELKKKGEKENQTKKGKENEKERRKGRYGHECTIEFFFNYFIYYSSESSLLLFLR